MPEGITRRGNSWRARYRNPETGQQHERSFAKQVDAIKWRRQQLDALDRGRWVDPQAGKVSFLRYFESWERDQVWTDGTHKAMSLAVRSATFAELDQRVAVRKQRQASAAPEHRRAPLAHHPVASRGDRRPAARPSSFLRVGADRLGLRRGGRPAGSRARQVHDHPDDVRAPVAQRREPGPGRVSAARGRGPWLY